MALTEEARKLRNAYQRELYRRNRERELKRQEEYWNKKAEALKNAPEQENESDRLGGESEDE
jgi:hypothetical protein